MKKLTAIAIATLALLLMLTSTPANAWTLEDCQKVQFQHPDCIKYKTPTPKPTTTKTASPTPAHSATPTRTASAAPTVQTPTPTFPPGTFPVQPTAKPTPVAPTVGPAPTPLIRQLPSTSTD